MLGSVENVVRPLGNGGHGVVEEVEVDGQHYARKTFKLQLTSSVVRELVLLHSVEHPNIVRMHRTSLTTESSVAYLELADQCLYDYMNESRPLRTIAKVVHSILCGLKVLHDRNLVHGDLTPFNILMFDDVPKLADFGGTTPAGANVTTVNESWTAPELLVYGRHSTAMDMWALGITLYSWLSGKDPWPIDTKASDLLSKQLGFLGDSIAPKTPIVLPDRYYLRTPTEVKEQWTDLTLGCLRMESEQRWTVDQALDSPLFKGMSYTPPVWHLTPAPPGPTLRERLSRYLGCEESYPVEFLISAVLGLRTREPVNELVRTSVRNLLVTHQYHLHLTP